MKTIEQIAIQLTLAFEETTEEITMLSKATCYELGVKSGLEYAQKWIPITEQLPPINVYILVKDETGLWDRGMLYNIGTGNQWMSSSNLIKTVVSWKPESREL